MFKYIFILILSVFNINGQTNLQNNVSSGAGMVLIWNPPDDTNSYTYNVYMGNSSTQLYNIVTNTPNTSIYLPNVVFCQTNCYVTALDNSGDESNPSNVLLIGLITTLSSTNLNLPLNNWTTIAKTVVDETTNNINFFIQKIN